MIIDDLQSKYNSKFNTKISDSDRHKRLSISNDSDDYVIISAEARKSGFDVMFKENGSAGTPDDRETVDKSDLEETVERFVGRL